MKRPQCCFIHPEFSSELKDLDDLCPHCSRAYGFPLTQPPTTIDDYTVVAPVGRGFYSAAYHVTQGALEAPYVLKVSPKGVYEAFAGYGKDFEAECRLHRDVARDSDHLVPIHNMFEADVAFGDVVLPCHVAVLDLVEGTSLDEILEAEPPPPARTVAQIALDLLQLLEELQAKGAFHNDLHEGNIIVRRLGPTARRAEALDDSIRVMAIDLGSTRDESRSDEKRFGDLRSVAAHLQAFADKLLVRPGAVSDLDYRLAAQLQEIASLLSPDAVNQRPPEFGVLQDRIRQAHDFVSSPWKEASRLRSFDDSYNAQTLHPWFVSRLLVDPDGRWHDEISVQGPQVVTGMRGCGKTMLLRSLMFHARAARPDVDPTELPASLTADGYVGLYVSCNRLLDPLGSDKPLHAPESRLFVAYVREALRAIRHLREIDRGLVSLGAARRVGQVLADYVSSIDERDLSDDELVNERLTLKVLASLQRGESTHTLQADPTASFIALAESLRDSSAVWAGSSIYYLLDDVSTRHLDEASIQSLVSRLLFQSDVCAFKMTTEEQTLMFVLRSPGLVERARPGRDYKVFPFGAHVIERINAPLGSGGGKSFVAEVLALRARQFRVHPPDVSPAQFLGDVKLTDIASDLARLSPTAAERKTIYRGLRALTAVCVGDIGDVLAIYETMFRRSGPDQVPFDAALQHRCFQDYCSQRLYQLNHKSGRYKDFALTFAQAARDLLVDSAGSSGRLRQYTSIYVRLTTEDPAWQDEQLRALIDAGVFVLDGGAPRSKTRDDDPIQQFILKYRKLFGLAIAIGLADRDRFELSGDDLLQWLREPKDGVEILKRNLQTEPVDVEAETDLAPEHIPSKRASPRSRPATLFDDAPDGDVPASRRMALERMPVATQIPLERLGDEPVVSAVLACGFEDRTLESTRRLLDRTRPERVMLVRYEEAGHGDAIEALVRDVVPHVDLVHHHDLGPASDPLPPDGPTLVDVTGLTKPMIYQSVRRALAQTGVVFVAHTKAERHYPLDEQIEPVLAAQEDNDIWALLERLDDIWMGEAGPYEFERLLLTDADESRRRLLVASASPKHHRLLSLVQGREYDALRIFAPPMSTPRGHLARRAAEVAIGLAESAEIITLDPDDLPGALEAVAALHQEYYVDGNFSLELGLTGSKMHAVAFAAASAAAVVSQAWYVRPNGFDSSHFSAGVGETTVFELRMREPVEL